MNFSKKKTYSLELYNLQFVANNIHYNLSKSGANNIISSNDRISYKNELWGIGNNLNFMTSIDEGYFIISEDKSSIQILHKYKMSFIFEIIGLTICILLVFGGRYFYIIGIIFIVIEIILRLIIVSTGVKDLMSLPPLSVE